MAVRSSALVVGPRRIVVLHGKQARFLKDIKRKCSLQFKVAVPRISMLLSGCRICCVEKDMQRPIMAGVPPRRDGRYYVGSIFLAR
jgi:hypothetical protein